MAESYDTSVKEPDNLDYQKRDYWESRFQTENSYDWCCKLEDFVHLLEAAVSKLDSILVLGCGSSPMSAQLYQKGYNRIINIDYSETVTENMARTHASLDGMTWRQMDMYCLDFPASSFDCVLEKATLEVLFVAERDPWNVSDAALADFTKLMRQIDTVLKPGGKFISISFTQPHFRLPLLKKVLPSYDCSYETFGSMFHYFMYVIKKPAVDPHNIEKPVVPQSLVEKK